MTCPPEWEILPFRGGVRCLLVVLQTYATKFLFLSMVGQVTQHADTGSKTSFVYLFPPASQYPVKGDKIILMEWWIMEKWRDFVQQSFPDHQIIKGIKAENYHPS